MVEYDTIIKVIDTYIEKCNSSSKAMKRGDGVLRTETANGFKLSYDDGTEIEFINEWDEEYQENGFSVKTLSINGKTFNYPNDDAYNLFPSQDETLNNSEAEINEFTRYGFIVPNVVEKKTYDTEYEFCQDYVDMYASSFGLDLNKKLNEGIPLEKYVFSDDENGDRSSSPSLITKSELHTKHFIELERNNPVDSEDIVCMTFTDGFHESDKLEKEHYRTKGFTSTTIGGEVVPLKRNFGGEDGWTILTTIDKGSGVKGMFFGNMINDTLYQRFGQNGNLEPHDWECELNFPPNTKFCRDLIDEENHIIIQHIEAQ